MWNWIKTNWSVVFLIGTMVLFLAQVMGMAYLFVKYGQVAG